MNINFTASHILLNLTLTRKKTLCLKPTLLSQTVIIPSTDSSRDKHPWEECKRMKFNNHMLFWKAAKDAALPIFLDIIPKLQLKIRDRKRGISFLLTSPPPSHLIFFFFPIHFPTSLFYCLFTFKFFKKNSIFWKILIVFTEWPEMAHNNRCSLGVHGWLSQLSIWLLILAQVMISRFVSLSPALGSALTVQSLFGILSLPLPHSHMYSCALSLK